MSREKAAAALEALREATLFALVQGDRYQAMGRKATANLFYGLLPILAKAKGPLSELTADEAWPKVAPHLVANRNRIDVPLPVELENVDPQITLRD